MSIVFIAFINFISCKFPKIFYLQSQNDLLFLLGVDLTVRMQALYAALPVFYYQFSFEGELGMGKKVCGVDLPGEKLPNIILSY